MSSKLQVVWFFGTSAAGKNTLIRKLQSDPNFLSDDLQLNSNIKVCEESLGLVGKNCPTNETRDILLDCISNLLQDFKPNTSLLVKGQAVELYDNKLHLRIKSSFPHARHRIVFLRVDPAVLNDRWIDRLERGGRDNPSSAENAQRKQMAEIKNLENDFDVVYLDSTSDYTSMDEVLR